MVLADVNPFSLSIPQRNPLAPLINSKSSKTTDEHQINNTAQSSFSSGILKSTAVTQ
jgi:hypothetical protein